MAEPATELKTIISQVIEEADEQKASTKRAKTEADPTADGDQDEPVEGDVANDDPVDPEGPIKEHLLGEVHKRRGQKRKERTFGDDKDPEHILDQYDAPAGTQQHQEGELPEEDDGPVLAAFNMDEAEMEEKGLGGGKGEEEEDAWLQSLQEQKLTDPSKASTSGEAAAKKEPDIDGTSKKVTEAIRAKHEAQQKILDSNKPLSDAEIASARTLLLQHLLPREKVVQALARLSSERFANDPTIKARDRVGSKRVKQSKPVIIDALTDAATSLMTEDADAFELTREEIAHSFQISQITAPQPQPSGGGEGGAKSDGDDDMFADSDDDKQPAPDTSAAPSSDNPVDTNASAPPDAATVAAASGQGGKLADPAAGGEAHVAGQNVNDEELQHGTVPLGFILDRASGYYMHPESGWYYHLESKCYYHNGNWYAAGAVPTETA